MPFVLAPLTIALAGCQAAGPCGEPAKPTKDSPPKRITARVIDARQLVLGQECRVDQVLRLPDATGAGCRWQILVGPNPRGGPATLRYTNPEPGVFIDEGWIYIATGAGSVLSSAPALAPGTWWGTARTQRVAGSAEGTRFIVQEERGMHRVFLLSGPSDAVRVVLDGNEAAAEELNKERTYFQVTAADTALPAAATIPAPPDAVGELVEYIEGVAHAAGLP